jgi:hypothetical protein
MMDANYISERLGSIRQEITDLRITTARYWSKDQHTRESVDGPAVVLAYVLSAAVIKGAILAGIGRSQ